MASADPSARSRPWRVASRGSPLALLQARTIIDRLGALGVSDCEVVVVQTTGDRRLDIPIEQIGGQGAFVKEVQVAVLDGRADMAVHSAKDLPTLTPPGLVLASVPERADPRDAMVGRRLADLGAGAMVATGSARRRAQLAWLRPDLTFCDLRGNMERRVERAEEVGAGVLATCAMERLGMSAQVADVLAPSVMLPQVAQGALAVECREADDVARRLLALIDDGDAHRAVLAERAFLRALGGGCTLPVGALATAVAGGGGVEGGELRIEGMLASRDGRVLLRRRARGTDPEEVGTQLALGLLDDDGGRSLDDWAPVEP